MNKKAVLVTGPTRGLGRELVEQLVSRELCDVLVLVGRPGKALDDVTARSAAGGHIDVVSVEADLASLSDVNRAVYSVTSELRNRHRKLDAVALNAALQFADATTTTIDGLEATFGIGILANHAILAGLSSQLSTNGHVVIVGSGTHFGDFPATLLVPGPSWRSVSELAQPWTDSDAGTSRAGRRVYSTMKLGVNYLAAGWKERLNDVRINVYDPGLMPGTGLVRTGGWKQVLWNRVMPVLTVFPGVTTPQKSAKCFADLLVGEKYASEDGQYFEIGNLTAASDESRNTERIRDVMDTCDELIRRASGR